MATDNIQLQATTDVSGAKLGAFDDGVGVLHQTAMVRFGTGTDQTQVQSVSGAALPVEGPLAHSAVMPDGININVIGGYGLATAPTAVTSGDAVRAWFSLNGALNVNVVSGKSDVTVSDTALPVTISGTPTVNTTVSNTALPVIVSGAVLVSGGDVNVAVVGTVSVAGTISGDVRIIGTASVIGTVSGDVRVVGTVSVAGTISGPVIAAGDIAHDAADSGNPVKIGGVATVSNRAAVADGDRVSAVFDTFGRQVVHPFVVPEKLVKGEVGATGNMTTTDPATIIAAAAAGEKTYITSVSIFNSTTDAGGAGFVEFTDGATGPVIYSGYARQDGGGFTINGSTPIFWTSASTILSVQLETVSGAVRVNVAGFQAP